MRDEEKIDLENNESEYGEFVPTFYHWNTLENQKKIVNKLQNITDKNTTNKKTGKNTADEKK